MARRSWLAFLLLSGCAVEEVEVGSEDAALEIQSIDGSGFLAEAVVTYTFAYCAS